MSLLDLGILATLTLFAIFGFRNGIVRELLTIIGLVVAIYVAFRFMEDAALWLSQLTSQTLSAEVTLVTGLILFTVTFILFLLLAFLIRRFLEAIHLNIINRILGFIFGGLKAGIAVSAILLLLGLFGVPDEETRQESIVYPRILKVAPAAYDLIAGVLPGSGQFMEQFQSKQEGIERPGNY